MRNLNVTELLEIVEPAVIKGEPIQNPSLYNKEDRLKFLDNSWKDRAFDKVFTAIDNVYASRPGTANTILQCTTFITRNPGTKEEKKEEFEFYIYKNGKTYIVFRKLVLKE